MSKTDNTADVAKLYKQGFKYTEIAEALGLSMSGVSSAIKRARDQKLITGPQRKPGRRPAS